MKRLLCIVLVLIILISGCGYPDEQASAPVAQPGETAVQSEEALLAEDETLGAVVLQNGEASADFPETLIYAQEELVEIENVHNITMDGNTPYVWGSFDVYCYDNDLVNVLHVTSDDETGEGTNIEQVVVRNGNLYVFQETYQIINDKTEITQNIVCYRDGEVLFSCEDVGYRDEKGICCFQVDDEGYIYVMHQDMIRIMHPDGTAKEELYPEGGIFMWQLYRGGDGKTYVQKHIADTENDFVYYRLQPDGTMEPLDAFRESSLFLAADGTDGCLGYYFDGDMLSAISQEDYSFVDILSVKDSQLVQWNDVAVGEDHAVYGLYVEGDIFCAQARLCRLVPATMENLPAIQPKPTLTIAYPSEDELYIDPLVELYNESDGEYYLEAVYYQEGEMSQEEAYAAMEQDILDGNGPDLIVCSGNYRSLGQRGFLLDLYPYLDRDDMFSRENMMWLSALEDSGALYSIAAKATGFVGFLGLNESFGEAEELTLDSMKAVMEETGLYQNSRKSCWWLLSTLLPGYLPDAVDYATGTSDFQNETFYKMLELAKLVGRPDEPEEGGNDQEELFESYDSWFQRHPEDLIYESLDTLWDLIKTDSEITEDSVLFGIPGDGENLGLAVYFRSTIGICSGSDDPEGAWSVIRFMLEEMPEYYSYYHSVFRSDYEEKLREYLAPQGEYEGQEIVLNEDGTWYLDGALITEIAAPRDETAIPAEDIQRYGNMVENAAVDSVTDWGVCSVIQQALQEYFHGNGTTSEAAAQVEQAVNEYLMTLPKYE